LTPLGETAFILRSAKTLVIDGPTLLSP
jgi:hypothetical protein